MKAKTHPEAVTETAMAEPSPPPEREVLAPEAGSEPTRGAPVAPPAPEAEPDILQRVTRDLANAQAADKLQAALIVEIRRIQLQPTLDGARRLLGEIEALRAVEEPRWTPLVALPWEEFLARHPEYCPELNLQTD